MTLIEFFRLVANNLKTMLITGFILACVIFYGTMNETKEYSSHTIINTGLVSGYNLLSSGGERIDYAKTNNEMENLLILASSFEMTEELAMHLLAEYIIMEEPDLELIGEQGWEEMQTEEMEEVRKLIKVPGDKEKTLEIIKRYKSESGENPIKLLLFSKHPFFGIEFLQGLKISREGKSDQIRFGYSTIDPGICKNTLLRLTDLFIEKHKYRKKIQSTDVLEFFEQATVEAQENLNKREDRLLAFMVENKIINYYEQTRYIAASKEDLDEMYFLQRMDLAAADSALQRLEVEMKKQVSLPELNMSLVLKKEKLSELSSQIAKFEVFHLDSFPDDQAKLSKLQEEAEQLKEKIRQDAKATFAIQRTPEGVELSNLLTQWLNKLMEVEQAKARMDVFMQRKREFEEIYSKFAPWGSRIKRYERAIDVAERAYLENLHSYNQARLHKFNMMMSANLKVVDAPYMPLKPAPSKRGMLIIVGFLAGVILVLAGAVALELMDGSLKNPVLAREQTGMEVAGAFPVFPQVITNKVTIDFKTVRSRSLGQFLQKIKLHLRQIDPPNKAPKRVAILCTREHEGKTFVAQMAVEKLRASGERVAFIYSGEPLVDGHPDDFRYEPNIFFFEKNSEEKLVDNPKFSTKKYQYIFLELPGLLTDTYPVDLLAKYDLALVVARANRSWNHADKKAIENFKQGISSPPKLVLNGIKPEALEDSLGEIPKRRSKLRQLVKKVVLYLQPSG